MKGQASWPAFLSKTWYTDNTMEDDIMEIQIISGFLGTGKTTFLNKYLPMLPGLTAVVENEFGEVGLDGALLQEDIPVKELSAGCICCTLALDLADGIVEIVNKYGPDRILIEPSGIGKLSDVVSACEKVKDKIDIKITKRIVLVDACDCADFAEEFGQFYSNQIEHANIIFLSNVADATKEEMTDAKECIRGLNPKAIIYEGDFRELEKEELLALLEMAESIDLSKAEMADDMDVMFAPMGQMFSNITLEDMDPMTEEEIQELITGLADERFGYVLRAKGIVPAIDGGNWHFDFTVSKKNYEKIDEVKDVNRVIVIGSDLNKKALRKYIYSFGEDEL